MDEQYRDFYEKKAATYPSHDKASILRYEKAVALGELAPGSRVLDLACKNAVLLDILERQGGGHTYVGLDIAEGLISANRARRPDVEWHCADVVAGTDLPAASFDRIFALEILEHVPQPTVLLDEIRRLLAPEGRLLISVPNPYYYTEILNELRGRPDTEGHIFAFRDANMRALLELCGFEVEAVVGTYLQVPKRLRGAFSAHAFWLVERVTPILARSRVYRCRPGTARMREI